MRLLEAGSAPPNFRARTRAASRFNIGVFRRPYPSITTHSLHGYIILVVYKRLYLRWIPQRTLPCPPS